jgi:hypothetical protein
MRPLSPFRINTSKKSWRSSIAFIPNDFNSTRINTSVFFRFKSPRINTSKKRGGGRGAPQIRRSPIKIFRNPKDKMPAGIRRYT